MEGPRRIGKYEVISQIASGGFGVIYKAWDPFIKRPVAIKMCVTPDEDVRARFQREAQFVGNLVQPGRPQGGSTITQQVVKNLLVGDDVTYERKIREMIVASRLERALTKAEILELYLNSIYLGRSAWGVELAARRYFGKPAKELSAAEGAFLAGLTKGPSYFSPDRYPECAARPT